VSMFHLRGFTSLLLSLAFLMVAASGLLLWLAPPPASPAGGWLILGISKGAWKAAHNYVSIVLIAAAVVHLALNWSLYWGYLWNRTAKRLGQMAELALALAVVVGLAWAASLAGPGDHHGFGPKGPSFGHKGPDFGPKGSWDSADKSVAETPDGPGSPDGSRPASTQ
jgi:hypothetical protein